MLMVIFLLGIALLMLMIIKFKINPFLALIGTSILIGFGARLPLSGIASGIASGFGSTMTSAVIVIRASCCKTRRIRRSVVSIWIRKRRKRLSTMLGLL